MAFELKKREKAPSSSDEKENFFFNLLLDEQWQGVQWQLKPDESPELIFKMGFISGYRYLQNIVEIQTNSLRDSCGL